MLPIIAPGIKPFATCLHLWVYALLAIAIQGAESKDAPKQIGRIAHPAITESSGLAASRQHPEIFWTHSDGERPIIFAIKRDGSTVGEFRVEGATFGDWEDIALGPENRLYLADTGNNNRSRAEVAVYAIAEPNPSSATKPAPVLRKWVLRYPSAPFDSEGLCIWKDAGYLVSKVTDDRKAEIYRFALDGSVSAQKLEFVARLDVQSPVTGADVSAGGRYLALIAKAGPFVFKIDGDVSKAGGQKPSRVKFKHDSTEGCCFVPGGLIACAESREIYFFSQEGFGLSFD